MTRIAQVGIAITTLGIMITIMGLFPGVSGLSPTPGIGLVQLFVVLGGFTLLISGALMYVKFAFYATKSSNLAQQIGTRLAMTGLVLAAMSGLADSLGFGTHGSDATGDFFLGPVQAAGILGSFIMACIGVLVYAVGGRPEDTRKASARELLTPAEQEAERDNPGVKTPT